MAPEFGETIHPLIPRNRAQKTSPPGAARYAVQAPRAFEIKYSESMRDPRLPKSAEAGRRARINVDSRAKCCITAREENPGPHRVINF